MNLKSIFLIIIFSLIFVSGNVFSQYYADIRIDVENTGHVTITGDTNYILLQNISNSQLYTSKKENIWTLDIQTEEIFEDFIFELVLPKNSKINYIKTTPTFRIENEDSKIKIIGTGENKPITIILQYEIEDKIEIFTDKTLILFLSLFLILAIGLVIFMIFRLNHKDKHMKKEIQNILKDKSKTIEHKETFDYSILPERQQEIIKILEKEKKITQKDLEDKLKIPKSSVSRNVSALVQKNIVKKENVGISNYLSLK